MKILKDTEVLANCDTSFLLQSSIARRIRLSINWYNVASDATYKA